MKIVISDDNGQFGNAISNILEGYGFECFLVALAVSKLFCDCLWLLLLDSS